MSSHSSIYVGTTSIVELDGLATADESGDVLSYQNDATVTMESLVDAKTGEAVSGVTVPLTMAYVASSNGKYQATIPHGASVAGGRKYEATILAISAAGHRATWTETVIAKRRQA